MKTFFIVLTLLVTSSASAAMTAEARQRASQVLAEQSQLYSQYSTEMEKALDKGIEDDASAVVFCVRAGVGVMTIGFEGLLCEVFDYSSWWGLNSVYGMAYDLLGFKMGFRDRTVWGGFAEGFKRLAKEGHVGTGIDSLFTPSLYAGVSIGYIWGKHYKDYSSLEVRDGYHVAEIGGAMGWGAGIEGMMSTDPRKSVYMVFVSGYFGDAMKISFGTKTLFFGTFDSVDAAYKKSAKRKK